jgi:hypothetical protein
LPIRGFHLDYATEADDEIKAEVAR